MGNNESSETDRRKIKILSERKREIKVALHIWIENREEERQSVTEKEKEK